MAVQQQQQQRQQEMQQRQEPKTSQEEPHGHVISYETLFWVGFLTTTALFVADRFSTNLWPRQSFSTATYTTGSDNFELKTGPWSVVLYDVIARFTGRYSMAALNALFFSMMHTTHEWAARSWLGRRVVDFSDETARLRIHKWIGISLCVLTIVHVWSILFPVMFSAYTVEVKTGTFDIPLTERKPSGFKDVNVDAKHVMMQGDDMWRLVLMSVLLGPVVYLSVRWLSTNFRLGIRLHQFVMLMYFVDIARRHTHPHSWVLNVPFFVAWLTDRIVGMYYLSEARGGVPVHRTEIGSDYMVLRWKARHPSDDHIGQVFYMREVGDTRLERKHPFTSFARRNALPVAAATDRLCATLHVEDGELRRSSTTTLALASSSSPGAGANTVPLDWNRGVVLRTYEGAKSRTGRMRKRPGSELQLDVWGGYNLGGVAKALRQPCRDVVLIAGGSGLSYLVDAVSFVTGRGAELLPPQREAKSIQLIFATKDLDLAQWFAALLDEMAAPLMAARKEKNVRVAVRIFLTSGKGARHSVRSVAPGVASSVWGSFELGRPNLVHLARGSAMHERGDVFCQGGLPLQAASRRAARGVNFVFHEAPSFDNPNGAGNLLSCWSCSRKSRSGEGSIASPGAVGNAKDSELQLVAEHADPESGNSNTTTNNDNTTTTTTTTTSNNKSAQTLDTPGPAVSSTPSVVGIV